MRILQVIVSLEKAAGTSVFCAEIANGLADAGHEVTVAVSDATISNTYPLRPSVKLVSLSSILGTNSQDISANHYDVVHIHALWTRMLHVVSNWAYRNKMPVVWSPHGMLTVWAMNNKKWKKKVAWWLYQKRDLGKAALLHATAESEVEDIRRVGLHNRVVIAPLGVAVNRPRKQAERTDGIKVLLFVSRVQKKKGLLNLVKAWALLKHSVYSSSNGYTVLQNWKVRIVGPDQEGHAAEVKDECARLGVSSDWDLVGPKYGDELQEEYANADLFVLPTHSENFGSVVIEALAHSIPVITTKGTPWVELQERKCGWWIDVGVRPLVCALRSAMMLTDNERMLMGTRGRKYVEEKYTWAAVLKKISKAYQSITKT